MITLVMFSTEKKLSKLTGLDHEKLTQKGFTDWSVGFQTEELLKKKNRAECLIDGNGSYSGFRHIKYRNKHYYIK